MHCYVRRQVMCTFLEANNVNAFAMLCKFLDPTMEKPQYWIVYVNSLGNDEEAHPVGDHVSSISLFIFLQYVRTIYALEEVEVFICGGEKFDIFRFHCFKHLQ